MKKIFIWCLLTVVCSSIFPQLSKEDALQRIYSRQDLKVTEIEKDLYKIENKITGDAIIESLEENMKNKTGKEIDSMVIEIFSIDT
jgi:peptidoglycan hydrolase CwlO-like protein